MPTAAGVTGAEEAREGEDPPRAELDAAPCMVRCMGLTPANTSGEEAGATGAVLAGGGNSLRRLDRRECRAITSTEPRPTSTTQDLYWGDAHA